MAVQTSKVGGCLDPQHPSTAAMSGSSVCSELVALFLDQKKSTHRPNMKRSDIGGGLEAGSYMKVWDVAIRV